MPLKLFFASGVLCALFAICSVGCDAGDGGGAAKDLIGTWVRTKTFQPGTGSDPEVDTWTLTFRADGTFTLVHVHEEVVAYTPVKETTARDGEYSVESDGRISLSGGWAENLDEVTSLDDLAAVYMNFTQNTFYMLIGSNNVLFLGPDFNIDSVYVAGDSYNLLFSDGGSTFQRESNLVLTDGSGTIVEQRIESYAYTLIDATACSVAYSFADVSASGPTDGTGTVTECEYFYEPDKPVDGLDGTQTTLPVIRFEYTLNNVPKVDNFAMVGDSALISYQPSLQTKVLVDNAYIKAAN
jgi:hypothetical protein